MTAQFYIIFSHLDNESRYLVKFLKIHLCQSQSKPPDGPISQFPASKSSFFTLITPSFSTFLYFVVPITKYKFSARYDI